MESGNYKVLPENEKQAHYIRLYTSESRMVNSQMWKHKSHPSRIKTEEYFDDTQRKIIPTMNLIHHVNSALLKTPPVKEDFDLYTGVRHDPNIVKNMNDGILHVPSFTSTSIYQDIAFNFAKPVKQGEHISHVLKIHIKKGQQVGGDISHMSSHPRESEFLLKPNLLFKFHAGHSVVRQYGERVVHIHKVSILEPHEIEHLTNNPEIESHKNMKMYLDGINSLTESNKVTTEFEMGIGHRE